MFIIRNLIYDPLDIDEILHVTSNDNKPTGNFKFTPEVTPKLSPKAVNLTFFPFFRFAAARRNWVKLNSASPGQ